MPVTVPTCRCCIFHTVDKELDRDDDTRNVWRCWMHPGKPEARLVTNSDREPMACMDRCDKPKC